MKIKSQIKSLCIPLCALLLSQVGCSTFSKMFKKKPNRREVARQKKAKMEQEGKAKYAVIAAKTSCDGVKDGYLKIYNYAVGKKERRIQTAVHLGKCGHWDLVFGKLAKSNQVYVNHMMDALVAANLPVHKEYNKWISTAKQPYRGQVGWYTFTWTRNWLSKSSQPKQHCKAMWDNAGRATRKMYPNVRHKVRSMMIGYLFMADCREYHDKINDLLTSDSWRDRNQACHFMKKWGKSSDLRKISILGNTDGHFRIYRGRRIYDVRNACRAAAGQIRMRN